MNGFSPWVVAVLVAVLAASGLMLSALMRGWTSGRRRARLSEWAHRAEMTPASEIVPALRSHLGPLGRVGVVLGFASEERFVFRLRAQRTPASKRATDPSNWLLVGMRADRPLAMTLAGLRPARRVTSLIDVLAAEAAPRIWSYPSLETAEKAGDAFTIFAGSAADAAVMAQSVWPGRVSDDLALLVADGWVILDLSSRNFDELELTRAMNLLTQLIGTDT